MEKEILKPTDLFIGDYVELDDGRIHKVKASDLANKFFFIDDKPHGLSVTKEILEKMGFKKDEDESEETYILDENGIFCIYVLKYLGMNGCHLTISEPSSNTLWVETIFAIYVHELQHLLKSCLLDKEFNL